MNGVLLDTHTWAWTLYDDPRLSTHARRVLDQAESIFVSPISFFEIGQKVRIGKWPQLEAFAERLPALLTQQGGQTATLTPEVCLKAATLDWIHRDPFDRMIAATALGIGMPLLSADTVFDDLVDRPGWVARLW